MVDTDVLSWIALAEGRWQEFATLVRGHQLFISFVTSAEVQTFLNLGVLAEERADALRTGLGDYAVLEVRLSDVVSEWAGLRSNTRPAGTADDRERRQNDTWIAACALSVEPPLPVVTGNLRDFSLLAANSALTIIHPDLGDPAS